MSTTYGQFCPVSKAAEIVCERWTPLIVRELLAGSSRFNELRRGLPGCSSALLSQRLRALERSGVIVRTDTDGVVRYVLTDAGWELFPLIEGLGKWGQRWARSDYTEAELDPAVLMWDVRRYLAHSLSDDRCVVQFSFPSCPAARRHYWVVLDDDQVDVCVTDPGWPVDATIVADLRALTRVWMGDETFSDALRDGRIIIAAPTALSRKIPRWFGSHPILATVPSVTG